MFQHLQLPPVKQDALPSGVPHAPRGAYGKATCPQCYRDLCFGWKMEPGNLEGSSHSKMASSAGSIQACRKSALSKEDWATQKLLFILTQVAKTNGLTPRS